MSTKTTDEAPTPTLKEMMLLVESLQQQVKDANNKPAAKKYKFMVKFNKSQGLFIQDTAVKTMSEKTSKEYTPSMNIHAYQLGVLRSILTNETYRKAVISSMDDAKEIRL